VGHSINYVDSAHHFLGSFVIAFEISSPAVFEAPALSTLRKSHPQPCNAHTPNQYGKPKMHKMQVDPDRVEPKAHTVGADAIRSIVEYFGDDVIASP